MSSLSNKLRDIAGVVSASQLKRPAMTMMTSGIPEIDTLTGGLPRGGLTEVYGAASSGRTSLMIAALAAATARNELCALVDLSDCFDPKSAETAGVNLDKLLWVRCGEPFSAPHYKTVSDDQVHVPLERCGDLRRALEAKQETGTIMPPAKIWYGRTPARSERTTLKDASPRVRADQDKQQNRNPASASGVKQPRWRHAVEQGIKAADLIVQSGGFGVVVFDMSDVPVEIARRIPLTSWFRFRRAVENTPTVFLVIGREACAKTCASIVLRTASNQLSLLGNRRHAHTQVFVGIESAVEVVRTRVERMSIEKKQPRAERVEFSVARNG